MPCKVVNVIGEVSAVGWQLLDDGSSIGGAGGGCIDNFGGGGGADGSGMCTFGGRGILLVMMPAS
jgi:hypothetical protein